MEFLALESDITLDLKLEYKELENVVFNEKIKFGFFVSNKIKIEIDSKEVFNVLSPLFKYRFVYGEDSPSMPIPDLKNKSLRSRSEDGFYDESQKRGVGLDPHCRPGWGCLWERLGQGFYSLPQSKYNNKVVTLEIVIFSFDQQSSKGIPSHKQDYHVNPVKEAITEMGYQNACFDDLLLVGASGVIKDIHTFEDENLYSPGWGNQYRIVGLGEKTVVRTTCCGADSFYPTLYRSVNSSKGLVGYRSTPLKSMYLGVKEI